jgi:hypothetical protein
LKRRAKLHNYEMGSERMQNLTVIQIIATLVMGWLTTEAIFHGFQFVQLRIRFRAATKRIQELRIAGVRGELNLFGAMTKLKLPRGFVEAVRKGDRRAVHEELLPEFDLLIDRCERGLQNGPTFGLMFTVLGGFLAILAAVAGGNFDRMAMVGGIGVSMLTTAVGMVILAVETHWMKATEALELEFRHSIAEALVAGPAKPGLTKLISVKK